MVQSISRTSLVTLTKRQTEATKGRKGLFQLTVQRDTVHHDKEGVAQACEAAGHTASSHSRTRER